MITDYVAWCPYDHPETHRPDSGALAGTCQVCYVPVSSHCTTDAVLRGQLHHCREEVCRLIKVETSVVVNQPSDQVFAFISNFENNPVWQSGMQEAKFTSEGPLGIGSTYSQVAKFLGRRIESTFEVVDYEPDRMVKATSTSGSFPITFTRIVESVEEKTKVTAIVEGDASGFFKLAEPVLARMVKRSVEADYVRLKSILEAQS